tara:strand:+ start:15862 stop:17187 length:1326 start_codon:yes stop_codon:yes gene_type:complete
MNLSEEAVTIFKSTLSNVDPKLFIPEIVTFDISNACFKVFNEEFKLEKNQTIYVIGSGKASATMAEAIEKIFSDHIHSGLIIAPPHSKSNLRTIQMLEGNHPIPDKKSLDSTEKYLEFIQSIPPGSYVFNLISGGTSALLCKPVQSISIEDLQQVFKLLIESGASIQEINTVRKTLSEVKGGQLLKHLKHVHLLDLIISDVPDDDLRFIGSGPTVAQEISYAQSIAVTKKYELWKNLPENVQNHLKMNAANEDEKTILQNRFDFDNHKSWIVSSAVKVAKETSFIAKNRGFDVVLFEPAWTGSIDDFEEFIYQNTTEFLQGESKNMALIFFGECTVNISGNGKGGRNQELALRMAKSFSQINTPITFLSAGTDGIDGPTDAAGAVIDENTFNDAKKKGLDPQKFLNENDSYHFFKQYGNHIVTGPTGNNVMDLQIVLINGS